MTLNRITFLIVVYFSIFIEWSYGLCPKGYFKIQSMKVCYPLLTCKDLDYIKIRELVGFGSTKKVFLADWKGLNVSLCSLKNNYLKYDFYHGLHILKALEPNDYIVQLVGYCELNDVIITEYHENNNAINYENFRATLDLKQKINICINYIKIINYLHNSPIGKRVNCDSNDLIKLLSQLLITRNLGIILGDVDALPELEINSTVKCGMREITSSFAAPEQKWRGSASFQIKFMKGYNEKIDIWKIPDVCEYFLRGPDFELLQYRLFSLHKKCKDLNHENRPSAKDLILFYEKIRDSFL